MQNYHPKRSRISGLILKTVGNRSNDEEDETAVQAAREVARGMKNGSLPPFIGIRIKPFTEEMKERGLRTLELFVTTLVKETEGRLPDNFVVMLPKVTIPEQVSAWWASSKYWKMNWYERRIPANGNDGGNHPIDHEPGWNQSIIPVR